MRKLLSYFFILFGIGLMAISTSRVSMKRLSDYRKNLAGPMGEHSSQGGDLVRMSYLDRIPKFLEKKNYVYKKNADSLARNIDLYFFGDSYAISIPDSAYAHINKLTRGRRGYYDLIYKLDSGKRNILLVQMGERFVRTWFNKPEIFKSIVRRSDEQMVQRRQREGSGIFNLSRYFNPAINQNLEYNMFNYNFINWIREMKAEMNCNFFRRASGDVALSDNGEFIFLRQTVEPNDSLSSYKKIEKEELLMLVKTIDSAYKYYKKEGFDEVYFSIIPNPATILQPQNYNELIPALEKELSRSAIPFISIYAEFRSHPSPASLYRAGDTHWNNNGCQLWLKAVNQTLNRESKQQSGS